MCCVAVLPLWCLSSRRCAALACCEYVLSAFGAPSEGDSIYDVRADERECRVRCLCGVFFFGLLLPLPLRLLSRPPCLSRVMCAHLALCCTALLSPSCFALPPSCLCLIFYVLPCSRCLPLLPLPPLPRRLPPRLSPASHQVDAMRCRVVGEGAGQTQSRRGTRESRRKGGQESNLATCTQGALSLPLTVCGPVFSLPRCAGGGTAAHCDYLQGTPSVFPSALRVTL